MKTLLGLRIVIYTRGRAVKAHLSGNEIQQHYAIC